MGACKLCWDFAELDYQLVFLKLRQNRKEFDLVEHLGSSISDGLTEDICAARIDL